MLLAPNPSLIAEVLKEETHMPRLVMLVHDDGLRTAIESAAHTLDESIEILAADSLSLDDPLGFPGALLVESPRADALNLWPLLTQHPDVYTIVFSPHAAARDHAADHGAHEVLAPDAPPRILRSSIRRAIAFARLHEERARLREDAIVARNMLRITAHELKKPLQDFRSIVYVLRGMLNGAPNTLPLLERADASSQRMSSVIRLFLDTLSAIEPSLSCLNVSDVVRAAMRHFEAEAARKSITFNVKAERIAGLVMADHKLLTQALDNLVSNAIKFSTGGTEIEIWVAHDGDHLRINVADHGPGIPSHERALLFRAFTPLTPRPTAGEDSHGLGLWIVRQLVERQHGTSGAEFPADGGAIFWLELPRVAF